MTNVGARFVTMARRIIANAPARLWVVNDGYSDSIRTSGEYSGKGWGGRRRGGVPSSSVRPIGTSDVLTGQVRTGQF